MPFAARGTLVPMLKRILSLGAAVLAGLTAACEDGPATMAGTWRSPAAWSTMIYAASDGPILVEVHGKPFTDSDFPAKVAQSLSRQVIGRVVLFTPDRAQAPRPDIRLVLAFNPPETLDSKELCTGDAIPTAADRRDKVTVLAAFCQGDSQLASARGWVGKVEGPDDKRFRQMMGQLARELFQDR